MFTARLNLKQVRFPLDEQPDWLNDPRNTVYSEQRHRTHDKVSCAEYIKDCSMFWGIQETDTGDWIGTIAAHIDENNEIADLGILIHWEYHGQGYGREAWDAVCDFLLNDRKLRKIEAGCRFDNLPMRKLAERRIGEERKPFMEMEGMRKGHFLSDAGHPVDMVLYGKWPEKR